MPTPAVNLALNVPAPLHTTWWDGSEHTYINAVTAVRQARPPSVSNPRRADNTRAPRSYWSRWQRAKSSEGEIISLDAWGAKTVVRGAVCIDLPYEFPSAEDADGLLSNCRHKALSKGTEKSMQLNAALAQARDTARMVGSASSTLARGIDSLMAGPKGLARRFGRMANWRKAPDSYLEYLYGWSPLADDVANAFDQLNEYKNREFGYAFTLRAAQNGVDARSELRYAQTSGNGGVPIVNWDLHREIGVRVGYTFVLPAWFVQQTPTIAPFSTYHELTRWSFVLDWFLPIGNWIGAMESAQFAPHFKEGFEVYRIQDTWTVNSFLATDPWGTKHQGSSNAEVVSGTMARSAIWNFPWSVLEPPTFRPLPGIQQAAQGLALLTQVFKRWQ